MTKRSATRSVSTIGVDLGDRTSRACVVDEAGEVIEEASIATTASSLERTFARADRCRVVLETGAHANWVHDVRSKAGHEVVVANSRDETEFTSHHLDAWAYRRGVAIDMFPPGRPVESAFIESFNGKLRDECLDTRWFSDLYDPRRGIRAWRLDYNEVRPPSHLVQLPAATHAAGGSC